MSIHLSWKSPQVSKSLYLMVTQKIVANTDLLTAVRHNLLTNTNNQSQISLSNQFENPVHKVLVWVSEYWDYFTCLALISFFIKYRLFYAKDFWGI